MGIFRLGLRLVVELKGFLIFCVLFEFFMMGIYILYV